MGPAHNRQGFVRPHGHHGLRTLFRHGHKDIADILPGVMKIPAQPEPGGFIHGVVLLRFFPDFRQVLKADQVLHPFRIRVGKHIPGLDFRTFQKGSFIQVGFQHIPAFQLPSADDAAVFLRQHTRL